MSRPPLFVLSPAFPVPSFRFLPLLSESGLLLTSRRNYWDLAKDTDHNYPRLLHVAQVITMQETIDNMLLMTWNSDSEPLSNLGEQSRSFLYTKLTQGQKRKKRKIRTEFQITCCSIAQKGLKDNFISGLRVDSLCVEPNSFAESFPDIVLISLFLEILSDFCGR